MAAPLQTKDWRIEFNKLVARVKALERLRAQTPKPVRKLSDLTHQVEATYYTFTASGTGTTGVFDWLVGDDWNVDRPCLVMVNAAIDGTYGDTEPDPVTDPVTYVARPTMSLLVIDGDAGAVAGYESGLEYARQTITIPVSTQAACSVSLLMLRGRPKVSCTVIIETDEADTGLGAPDVHVFGRVIRL